MNFGNGVLIIGCNRSDEFVIKSYFAELYIPCVYWFAKKLSGVQGFLDNYQRHNSSKPSLILLEIDPDFIDSSEILAFLKQEALTKSVPIIAFGRSIAPYIVKQVKFSDVVLYMEAPGDWKSVAHLFIRPFLNTGAVAKAEIQLNLN